MGPDRIIARAAHWPTRPTRSAGVAKRLGAVIRTLRSARQAILDPRIDDPSTTRRRPKVPIVVIALCLALAGAVATTPLVTPSPQSQGLGHAALASSITSWGTQLNPQHLTATSCADAGDCVVVGVAADGTPGSIATTDRGRDWQTGVFPSGSTGLLNGVSCTDALHCWAVGTTSGGSGGDPTAYVTSNGGRTWSSQSGSIPNASSGGVLNAISCLLVSTNDECWAAGIVNSNSVVDVSTNGGTSWTEDDLQPSSSRPLVTIACVNASGVSCWTSSNQYGVVIYTTTNGGSTWSTVSGPSGASSINTFSCPSATLCFAAGSSGYPNYGAMYELSSGTWSTPVSVNWSSITGLSCESTTSCAATGLYSWGGGGASGAALIWNGTSWSAGISISSTSVTNTMPGSMQIDSATAVSCPTSSACFASGPEGVIGTQNGGSSWVQLYFIPLYGSSAAIACPTVRICYWAPGDDLVYKTVDGGASWFPQALPSSLALSVSQTDGPVNGVASISCADVNDCTLAGYAVSPGNLGPDAVGLATSNGGSTWSLSFHWIESSSSAVIGYSSIGCPPSEGWCLAVGAYSHSGNAFGASTYSGTPVVGATGPPVGSYLWSGISCPTATDCWVVGENSTGTAAVIEVTTNSGVTWTSQTPATGFTANSSPNVSCPTSSACFVDDGLSAMMDTTNGGSSWSLVTLPTGAEPGPISCPDATYCVFSNPNGTLRSDFDSTTNGGTSWTTTAAPSPGIDPTAVACGDDSDCWGIGESQAGAPVLFATDGIAAPEGGGITLPEVYAGLNPSEPCFSCYLKAQGAAAQSFVGEPINTATGDFYESIPLFSLPGRGIPISFTLSYDAEFSQAQVESGATSPGPDGWGWTDNYQMSVSIDPTSYVATIDQENGSQISFTPSSASACPSSYTAVAPRITTTLSCATVSGNTVYSLTSNGGLSVDAFTYNSSSQLTKLTETDANGYVTTVLFAQQGSNSMGANYNTACPSSATTCTVVSDPATRTFVLEYNSSDQLSGAVDPDGNTTGHTWSFGYDGSGNLTSITDRRGEVTSFGYDTSNSTVAFDHDMTSMTPPNGQSGGSHAGDAWAITYDSLGRVATQTDPQGLETSLSYFGNNLSPEGGTTTITDPHGNVEQDTYAYGILTSVTKGAGTAAAATWTYQRDPATLMPTTVIDPNGHITSSTDDANGNLLTVTDARLNTTTMTYNSFNEPLTIHDPRGIVTTYTYDSDGNVQTKVVTGVGGSPTETTTYTYGDMSHPGDLTQVEDPDGNITNYTYDTYGDRSSVSTYAAATSPTVPADKFSYSAISSVGSLASNHGTAITTLSVSPQTVGDVLAVGIMGQTAAGTGDVTSVTGGGVAAWHKVQQYYGTTGNDVEIWYGAVTTTGSSTITFTWSGTITGKGLEYNAQEFTAGLGSSTQWSVDTSGTHDSSSSTTVTYPSLTPGGSHEMYFGFAVVFNTGSGGSTSGFTYAVTADVNVVAYDTNVSGAVTPTAAQSPAGTASSAAVLLTASRGSSALSAVGSLASAHGSALSTLSVSPQNAGDILAIGIMGQSSSTTGDVTGLSGGGVTTWHKVQQYYGATGNDTEVWYGVITTTGSSTITFSWSGTLTGHAVEYASQEFTAGFGDATVWGVDTSGTHDSASSTTVTFPSLTPGGSGELYFGYSVVDNTASAGSTSGFSYAVTADANVIAYDTNVSSAVTPTASQSPAAVAGSAAVLLTASHASTTIAAVGGLSSAHGSALTTLSVAPQAAGDVLAVGVQGVSAGTTGDVTGLSGGGVTTWHKVQQYYGATGNDVEVWYGVITTTGSSTITFSWSGTITGHTLEYSAQEFTAGFGGSTVWSVDTSGTHDSSSSTTVTFPSLTPSGSGELYFGYAVAYNTGSGGSTSGFTYALTSLENVTAYDTNVSGAVTPTAGQSPAGVAGSAAVLLTASNGSGNPTVTGISPTYGSGAGGTSIAITGTSFTGATAVAFGTTPATSFTVNSATSITATAPAAAAVTVDVTVTVPTTATTKDSYDELGQVYCEVSPIANAAGVSCPIFGASRVADTSTWVYDDDGNVTSATDADGNATGYAYDGDGNQTQVTDPLTNVTETAYDADDRASSVTNGYGSGSATTTTYTYDVAPGTCSSAPTGTTYCNEVENGLSNTTTSYYNALDQMIEQAAPSTSAQTATTYTYDGVGNVVTKTDGSGTATYGYNADNQVTGITYSNTASGYTAPSAVTYGYDDDGNRNQMTDGTGTTTYGYNTLERLDSVSDGAGNVVTYGYDGDGNVTCISYPNSGSTTCPSSSGTGIVTYAYNGAGEETSMTDWLGSGNITLFGYDLDGNLTKITSPTGTTTSTSESYDDADALTNTSYTTGSATTDLAALGRNVDELIGSTAPSSGAATTYNYDSLNRVTTGTTASYTYDAASELKSVTPTGGSTTDFSYNSDGQLCWTATTTGSCLSPPTGATSFAFNTAGERVSSTPYGGNATTYGWDQAGNLVCETAPNSSSYSCASPHSTVTTTYGYNGDGLRMSDTPAGGSIQQFTWDVTGSVPPLLEDGTNYYLYGPNIGSAPLEQISISGSTPTYLVSDTTGVREQVGSTGSVVGSMSYDSYGNRCSGCSISTPFGFEGGYTDATALLYLVHRYYDPATEQFLSVDPLVDLTGTPYAFTAGDPINGVDPSGLMIGQPDTGGLSIQSILSNPRVLQGLSPNEVQSALQGTPGWAETRLYQGSQKGRGLAIRELVDPEEPPIGDNLTGQMITWTPGSAHHPNEGPYWKVSCNQNQGPPERVSASEATAPIRIASDQSDGLGGDVAPELEPELEPGPSIWEILSDSFFGGGEED